MDDRFFKQPILNSPYEYPARHWELDEEGQPTHQILERRRSAQFITPIPKPKKRKGSAQQLEMVDAGVPGGNHVAARRLEFHPARNRRFCFGCPTGALFFHCRDQRAHTTQLSLAERLRYNGPPWLEPL